MNKVYTYLATMLVLFGTIEVANASLIGDTVTISHDYPNIGTSFCGEVNIVVTSDASDSVDAISCLGFIDEIVNMNATGFRLDIITQGASYVGAFDGVSITGLNWSVGLPTGFDISTNIQGWNVSRLTSTNTGLFVNLSGIHFSENAYLDVSAQIPEQSIPEPSTIAILALGLVGLGARRLKK
jgi:hypothetical protein